MPVRISAIEDITPEELAALQNASRKRAVDPQMEELLSQVEAGIPKKVPLAEGQSGKGLRIAIARKAGERGINVATAEGDGYIAIWKVEQPQRQKGPRQTTQPEGQRKRGRPRKQQSEPISADGTPVRTNDYGMSETME